MEENMLKRICVIQNDCKLNEEISEIFIDFYDDMSRRKLIKGGCHYLSALLHMILSELDIPNELCLGNVKKGDYTFTHSWVSINGGIYDIAISNTNDPRIFTNGIIFNSYDTSTGQITPIEYGGMPDSDLVDKTGEQVSKLTLGEYVSNCPYGKNYIYEYIIDFAKRRKKYLNASKVRERYSKERWIRK